MHPLCPRCGEPLSEPDAAFCAVCGLPQLRMNEDTIVRSSEDRPDGVATPGDTTPVTDWRLVLRIAAGVAVIGAVLQSFATSFEIANAALLLWIMLAAFVTVFTYRRVRPTLPMNSGLGARFGLTTAMFSLVLLFLVVSASAFVMRYKFHSHLMDDAINSSFEQMKAQRPLPADVEAFFKTPEARGGFILLGIFISSSFLLLLMTIAGAVAGAALSTTPRRTR